MFKNKIKLEKKKKGTSEYWNEEPSKQMDLTDIYRTFYPPAVEYIFFSNTHRIFSRIDHVKQQNKS